MKIKSLKDFRNNGCGGKMTWNCRIVKKKSHWIKLNNGKKLRVPIIYGIHEAFYDNKKEKPHSITDDAMNISSESMKGLKWYYEALGKAFEKPILNYEDFCKPNKKRKK